MKKLFFLLFLTQQIYCQSNKTVELIFSALYNNENLELNKQYFSNSQKTNLSLSVFKFYVSHFHFFKNKSLVYKSSKNGFLINLENPTTLHQTLEIPFEIDFDSIEFYIGIDDKTNYDGISDGDLDPSNGMYWTWQTGYINIKIEGKFNKKEDFQFHLGGFLDPYISFQTIELKNITHKNQINININLNLFFENINLNETKSIMSPSKKAVDLSILASKMFGL